MGLLSGWRSVDSATRALFARRPPPQAGEVEGVRAHPPNPNAAITHFRMIFP